MDRSNIVTLISQTYTQNTLNEYIATEKTTDVFCSMESVGQREWAEASRQGFNPEIRLTMNRWEYSGEKIVEFEGQRYSVYRTYVGRGEDIELYLERQTGTEVSDEGQH